LKTVFLAVQIFPPLFSLTVLDFLVFFLCHWLGNLNCQKDSFQGQSGTKSPVKPTWSTKMTVFSTFLESSLNFLSNDIKKH